MAVEYNPNDYGHMTPGQSPGHAPSPGQYPVQGQPSVQPYQPQSVPVAPPQGQPVHYNPQHGQAAPQHPPAYHYQSPQQAPYPGQAYEPVPAQGYVPSQPGPQFQTPDEAQAAAQEDKPKSRFRRKKKARTTEQPRAQRVKEPADGRSGAFSLKPFLMGLVTGAVLTFAGLVFIGNQASKSLQADFDRVASELQQTPMAESAFIGEDGTIIEDIVIAENPAEQPE